MNSEQVRLLGIVSDYFAADGSFVRVPEEVLASLAAILTAPGQPFFADFDEVFTIAPEMVSLLSVGGVLSRCAAAYLLDEKGNSLPYSFVMMEGERIELPPLPAGYYTLELHGAHQMRRCLVIVAPQRVYQPETLPPTGLILSALIRCTRFSLPARTGQVLIVRLPGAG